MEQTLSGIDSTGQTGEQGAQNDGNGQNGSGNGQNGAGTATEMEKAMDRATVQDTVRPEAKREEFARLHKFCTNYLSDLLVDFGL